ncbi:unnamed protein product [Peniophora sp. CBMAI 1063]|nr:unnamed protein product [Peniophora sp. CBMAI 1063]
MDPRTTRSGARYAEFSDALPCATDLPFERLMRSACRLSAMVDARNGGDAPIIWSPTEPLTPLDSDDDAPSDEPQTRRTADVREVLDAVCGLLEDVELCEAERKSWVASTSAAEVGGDGLQEGVSSPQAHVAPSSPPSTPHAAPLPPGNVPPSSSQTPTEERRGRGTGRGQTLPREPRFRSCSAGATSPRRAEYRPPPRKPPTQTPAPTSQHPPSSHRTASVCEESARRLAGSDSESESQPDAPTSSGAKRKRGNKKASRQRKRAKGDGGAQTAQADGADSRVCAGEGSGKAPKQRGAKEKAYKQRRKALKRAQARADAARAKPYDKLHDENKYYARPRTVKLVNLKTFEVRYATQRGGYNSFSYKDKKVYTVQELKRRGFKELPWDGNDTVAILDNKNRLICVLLGPPKHLSQEEKLSWEHSMVELAKTLEQARAKHADAFAEDGKHFNHDRGVFAAFATGFTASNGKTGPSNLTYAHAGHRAVAEQLLKDGNMRRVAAFASEALAYYFPLVYKHLRERLRALCEVHPELRFPFEGLSIYPTVTFNLGPVSVTYGHNDGTNYAGIPCSITALGSFKAEEGGHLVLFDLRLYIKFPAGRTILLSSAGLRHGNTQLAPGDKRYSVTQYCQGSLIRWVAYGFRKSGDFTDAEKDEMDEAAGEGWAAQLGRFSTWKSLPEDRRAVVDLERALQLGGS